jgi:hypothetical protein
MIGGWPMPDQPKMLRDPGPSHLGTGEGASLDERLDVIS